jgi:hypothetical protein
MPPSESWAFYTATALYRVRIEPEPSVEVGNIITSSDRGDDSGV